MALKKTDPVLYSQYLDLKKTTWQKSGCGIASLGMVINFYKPKKKIDLNELYQKGLDLGGYLKGIGWRHQGIVDVAKNYGFKQSRAFDLAKESLEKASAKLKRELKKGPVIVSVYSKYIVGRNGHLVVLMGLTDKTALILNPDTRSRKRIAQEVSLDVFWPAWKKRFIVIA